MPEANSNNPAESDENRKRPNEKDSTKEIPETKKEPCFSLVVYGEESKLEFLKDASEKRELTREEQRRLQSILSLVGKLTSGVSNFFLNIIDELAKDTILRRLEKEEELKAEKKQFTEILGAVGINEEKAGRIFKLLKSSSKEDKEKGYHLLLEDVKKIDFTFSRIQPFLTSYLLLAPNNEIARKFVRECLEKFNIINSEIYSLSEDYHSLRDEFENNLKQEIYESSVNSNPDYTVKKPKVAFKISIAAKSEESETKQQKTGFKENRLNIAQKLISEISDLEQILISLDTSPFTLKKRSGWPASRVGQLEQKVDVLRVELKYHLTLHAYEYPN